MPRNRKNGKPDDQPPGEGALEPAPSPEPPQTPAKPKRKPTPEFYEVPYLRAWRHFQHRDWTQADLARAAGMSEYGVRRIETGQSRAKLASVLKLADALGVRMQDLLNVDPYANGPN